MAKIVRKGLIVAIATTQMVFTSSNRIDILGDVIEHDGDSIFNTEQPEEETVEQTNETPAKLFDINDYELYDYIFKQTATKAYLINKADLKNDIDASSKTVATLDKYTELLITGTNESDYYQLTHNDETCYVDKKAVTTDYSVIEKMIKDEEAAKQAEKQKKYEASLVYTHKWNGKKLNKKIGTIYGPTGKETYYNLNMTGVVNRLHRRGYKGEYWVRSDGCKMFGNYIMVAANFSLHKFGSIIQTSLGPGIVCDTGTFVRKNPTQIDIATNW